jgi:ABC-type maltose transport system permease subunit
VVLGGPQLGPPPNAAATEIIATATANFRVPAPPSATESRRLALTVLSLFVVVVGLLVVPLQTTLIPILKLLATWGMNGQFVAVWLAHTGYGLPFAVFLLRTFMGSLPREVFESAAIDGASPVTALFRLAVPMSIPAFTALAIFQFLRLERPAGPSSTSACPIPRTCR